MEEERFEVSPLKPSLALLYIPIYVFFLYRSDDSLFHPSLGMVLIIVISPIFIWKYLRLGGLALRRKPAVLLTDESVYIADSGYTIKWTDVSDVYLASDAPSDGVGTSALKMEYYIIIRVREPEKYLDTIKNPFLRIYRKLTKNLGPSPFEINLSWVRGDEDELFHIVLRYYQNNRGF